MIQYDIEIIRKIVQHTATSIAPLFNDGHFWAQMNSSCRFIDRKDIYTFFAKLHGLAKFKIKFRRTLLLPKWSSFKNVPLQSSNVVYL